MINWLIFYIGTIPIKYFRVNNCDASQFNQLKENINILIEKLIPDGKESNNLFTGKYLIDSLQFTDTWQGCLTYLNSLIGIKTVVCIKLFIGSFIMKLIFGFRIKISKPRLVLGQAMKNFIKIIVVVIMS